MDGDVNLYDAIPLNAWHVVRRDLEESVDLCRGTGCVSGEGGVRGDDMVNFQVVPLEVLPAAHAVHTLLAIERILVARVVRKLALFSAVGDVLAGNDVAKQPLIVLDAPDHQLHRLGTLLLRCGKVG